MGGRKSSEPGNVNLDVSAPYSKEGKTQRGASVEFFSETSTNKKEGGKSGGETNTSRARGPLSEHEFGKGPRIAFREDKGYQGGSPSVGSNAPRTGDRGRSGPGPLVPAGVAGSQDIARSLLALQIDSHRERRPLSSTPVSWRAPLGASAVGYQGLAHYFVFGVSMSGGVVVQNDDTLGNLVDKFAQVCLRTGIGGFVGLGPVASWSTQPFSDGWSFGAGSDMGYGPAVGLEATISTSSALTGTLSAPGPGGGFGGSTGIDICYTWVWD